MFKVEKRISNSLGRAGLLVTPHGEIKTPAFVAVGTKATVKSLTPEQIREVGSQIILANTYHLYLEPGEKIVEKNGGLHKFMNWPGPIMTDSGGFQAFSLGAAYGAGISKFIGIEKLKIDPAFAKTSTGKERKVKITEDGVEFRSIIDSSKHFFTPEKSIEIQSSLGADIIFVFDECTSPYAPKKYLREAMERTHRWAERCLIEHQKNSLSSKGPRVALSNSTRLSSENFFSGASQFLFGIIQGGRYEDLRKKSARVISNMNFDGFGVGGSFVKEDVATAVKWVNEILPEEKPRHLLGVGEPIDLVLGVENGCDTFDCVAPTRMARNGSLYTERGKVNIMNSQFKSQMSKIDKNCQCYTCQNYSVAYLSHLFHAKEMLAATLATIHNLYFLNNLMSHLRQSILEGKFFEFKDKCLGTYKLETYKIN